jgi:SAM-dependent methyltransferase
MATTAYDDALFARIYRSEEVPVEWDGVSSTGFYADMLEFCQPELLTFDGQMVDFGCGSGDLLTLLHQHYGKPLRRLLGFDFQHHLRLDIPFIEADLNRVEDFFPAGLEIAFGFASHLLEHLVDPRSFLRQVRQRLRPDGYLYIEVPDNGYLRLADAGVMPHRQFSIQHIQYFTPSSLTALVTSCGFVVERMETKRFAYAARLKMLLRVAQTGGAAEVMSLYFAGMDAQRRRLVERVEAVLDRHGNVGLWGLGAEFIRLMDNNAKLATALSDGRVALFDLDKAGRSYAGVMVRSPSEIASVDCPVFIVPMTNDVTAKMLRFARDSGFPEEQVILLHPPGAPSF